MIALRPRMASSEEGIALITAVLVMLVLGGLLAVVLTVGENSNRASVRNRNFDSALDVAEAGVDQATAQIESAFDAGTTPCLLAVDGQTSTGSFHATCGGEADGYQVTSTGTTLGSALRRSRTVRVHLRPPQQLFTKALFATGQVYVKNGSIVTGDIWGNGSVTVEQNSLIHGSITSAGGWINIGGGQARVDYNVQSGGFNGSASPPYAISTTGIISGSATASAPASQPCPPPTSDSRYLVQLTGGTLNGDLTTLGQADSPSLVGGKYNPNTCTVAPPVQPPPTFSYNPQNYNPRPVEYVGPGAATSFNNVWPTLGQGTFYINDPNGVAVNLQGKALTGDTTIISQNSPVLVNGISSADNQQKVFVVISRYTNDPNLCNNTTPLQNLDCAIQASNAFQIPTVVLLYAPNGDIAIKNTPTINCGAVYARNINFFNTATVNLPSDCQTAIQRLPGLGQRFVRTRFEELPASS